LSFKIDLIEFDLNIKTREKGFEEKMSYPFFRCVSCNSEVQKVICYEIGKLPYFIITHNTIPLSCVFETDEVFSFCRGQGMRYSEANHLPFVEYVDGYHYNFTAAFKGYCCFCALHAGFGTELFLSTGCYCCKHKQNALATFIEITKSEPGAPVSWQTHGWAALPSVIVDKILRLLIGDQLSVEDGRVMAPVPDGKIE
jgi:hypothetical protein